MPPESDTIYTFLFFCDSSEVVFLAPSNNNRRQVAMGPDLSWLEETLANMQGKLMETTA